ncbi:S66 peptidase family protein [uncultured Friedmanniella sp.]|uniref:S66 family peptidase n=1 Tax=uncultured Friedmanniella sp. TaxID=335381 RepID=UPI0035CC975B
MFPPKLRRGDTVRVVAPSRSRSMVTEHDHTALIEQRFAALGLRLTYGAHVDERDDFDSSPVASRLADLHEAFADPDVAAIMTVIGGFNSHELLPHLDWALVAAHPKVLCGYSDITALQNAILARTGLVTYSGPHWSTFGMRDHLQQTLDWFEAALFSDEPLELTASSSWTDDLWFLDQDDRHPQPNEGWWALRPGSAAGRIVGGNLCTFNLLQGGPYRPSLEGALLVVEDDALTFPAQLARDLTSLLQLPDAAGITGVVVGRFQGASGLTRDLLAQIVERAGLPFGVPVLANVDVGHTHPLMTLPIGGRAELVVDGGRAHFRLTQH